MFLDTSGLMCLFDRRDTRHSNAIKRYDAPQRRLSHNYVLAEFVALALARGAHRLEALRFIEASRNSPEIEVIWIDKGLHDRSMQLLRQRHERAWSLCDAVSFILMAEKGLFEALTTDHDFEQAGFLRLLGQ